jgi:hypothetical protein
MTHHHRKKIHEKPHKFQKIKYQQKNYHINPVVKYEKKNTISRATQKRRQKFINSFPCSHRLFFIQRKNLAKGKYMKKSYEKRNEEKIIQQIVRRQR